MDGQWFTGDDVIHSYTNNTYDGQGNRAHSVGYNNQGNDGQWFTDDDQVSFYEVYTRDAQGNLTQWVFYKGFGNDGIWFLFTKNVATTPRAN